jgi:hypothetical protein
MYDMMLKLKKNKIDLRLEFKNIDEHNSGNLSELIFVKILDNLKLTSNLNDQELITILRRFQNEKNYIYNEICDLFSHIFITSKNSSSNYMNNYDIQFLLNNLRMKTTQWRRAFRFFIICMIIFLHLCLIGCSLRFTCNEDRFFNPICF